MNPKKVLNHRELNSHGFSVQSIIRENDNVKKMMHWLIYLINY